MNVFNFFETLLELPLDFVKGLSNVKCMEKEEARFECKFNKEVNPETVSWFKDGVKLENGAENGRIQMINEGDKQILVIKDAKLDDAANYEIRVGNVKSTANLKVKGKKS
jgi:hypothetical protein